MTNVVDLNVNRAVDASGNCRPGRRRISTSPAPPPVTVYSDAAATTPHATPVVEPMDRGCSRRSTRWFGCAEGQRHNGIGAAVPDYPRDPVVIFSDTSTGASSISFFPDHGQRRAERAGGDCQHSAGRERHFHHRPHGYIEDDAGPHALHAVRATTSTTHRPSRRRMRTTAPPAGFTACRVLANLPEAGSSRAFSCWPRTARKLRRSQRPPGQHTAQVRTGGSWTAWVQMIDTGNIASYVGTTATIQNSTSGGPSTSPAFRPTSAKSPSCLTACR